MNMAKQHMVVEAMKAKGYSPQEVAAFVASANGMASPAQMKLVATMLRKRGSSKNKRRIGFDTAH